MIRRMGIVLFAVYVILLIYFLFFSEEYGRVAQAERVYRYNLVPLWKSEGSGYIGNSWAHLRYLPIFSEM